MIRQRPKTILILSCFLTGFLFLVKCNSSEESHIVTHDILGEKESCLHCHANVTGFSASHNPSVIGCSPCHLGNPRSEDEDKAHRDMVLIPGNTVDMSRTCGASNCHGSIIPRIENSLMTTMAGVITVDRYAFGESDTLTAYAHIENLSHSPADQHLRQLCASCHLGNEKTTTGTITEASRGGGCNACHLQYDEASTSHLHAYDHGVVYQFHPSLNIQVDNEKCYGCHSRSGRISTSYEGWHETRYTQEEKPLSDSFMHLNDGRVFQYIAEDIHHKAGLECIDCHSANDIMGDGNIYLHQEEAVKIKCSDCHQTTPLEVNSYDSLDHESKKLLALRNWMAKEQSFVKTKEGQYLYNVTSNQADSLFLTGKNTESVHYIKPPAEACNRGNAHNRLSCQSCHSAWAPQCIGCHHTYEEDKFAYDLLDHQKVQGKWVEHLGAFFTDLPSLGVVESSHDGERIEEIKTFVSGMIMSIDKRGYPDIVEKDETFVRYFASFDPHTTMKKGRSCESCHLSPLAIGYGRGELIQNKNGEWQFDSEYAPDPHDGLPQDAWVPFALQTTGLSTRPYNRSFNPKEQNRILLVGSCLQCHDGESTIMLQGLNDFNSILQAKTKSCIPQ